MEVLLTWKHPQFDGVGAKVFHEDFLGILNAEARAHERTGLDGDILRLPQAPPLLPTSIGRSRSLPVDAKYLTKALWEGIRPWRLNRDKTQATWCPIRSSPYKTRFRAFFIDQASLSAILALYRQNKATITGPVRGLMLIAFSSHLNSTAAAGFQSSTITDHRRNLPPAPPDAWWARPHRTVAIYVTQAFHRYEPKLVARIRSKLAAGHSEGRGT